MIYMEMFIMYTMKYIVNVINEISYDIYNAFYNVFLYNVFICIQ